jgi:hypothetical protein
MVPDAVTLRRAAALPERENAISRRYLKVLEKWVPVGVQYFNDWPDRPNCGHFLGGCHWYGIETIAGSLTFAAAASSPEYDARVGGVSREALREMALKGLRYLCFTHDSGPPDCVRPSKGLGRPENCGTKWGERGLGFFRESQCGLTVWGMAITALLLGDAVDDETWTLLAAVHEDYAGRFGEMAPKSGVYTNTQMEENGWTACGLASAELFLERHPMASTWAKTARRWMFSTVTTQQDTKNRAPFADGETAARLTGETFTTLPDYMAENHGMVHPGYTASGVGFSGNLGVIYGVFGASLPKHAYFNRQEIYDQLKRTTDLTGCMHPMQGMDWPYLWPDPGTGTHAAAALLLKDADGAFFERCALRTLEGRQDGNGGRMYDQEMAEKVHDIQDPLIIRESAIENPAVVYLLHRVLGAGPAPTPEKDILKRLGGVKVYPHSGFVFHRHRRGQTSFSWRNCIMALPLNSEGLYTVAPASNSFLASVRVKDRPDFEKLVSIRVDEGQEGFAAAMAMDRAQGAIRQEVLFAGLPNGTSLSWERLTAREAVTVEGVEQGFLRIINEDFKGMEGNCNGSRTLHTPAGAEVFQGFVTTDPDSDVVRTYDHPAWVNVDDRLGLVFRGMGRTVYHNRHYFKPWWAVADDLTLSRIARPFRAKAGETVGELAALIAPDQSHGRTAKQRLTVLSTRKRAAGLIADGHLAAASFEARAASVAFSFPLEPGADVPVFEGVTDVGAARVTYTCALPAGGACLRKALASVRPDGPAEITAAGGNVLVRNPGRRPLRVARDGSRAVRVEPGRVVRL